MNRVILSGSLGRDPEIRYINSGTAKASLSVATSERYKKDDQWQERTEWHSVIVWGKQAENVGTYLKKGSRVLIEGRIQSRDYEKDGQKRKITEIVADRVEFLGGGQGRGAQTSESVSDDDVPF